MPRARKHDGVVYRRKDSRNLVDSLSGSEGRSPEESQRSPKTGMKHRRSSEKGFRPETTTSLRSFERGILELSDNGRTSSWRTIPSHPCELRRHTKRIERCLKHLKAAFAYKPIGGSSPQIRSNCTFVNVFGSESESRSSSVTERTRSDQAHHGTSGVSESSDAC